MNLDIQFKLKNNPYALRYLHENSIWYKRLNREPKLYNEFIEEMKDRYGLRASYKIGKALETINMIQNVMSSLK